MKISICSMTRHHNKNDFIEWVKYHLSLGFDEFMIYDNSSDFSLKDCLNEINDKRVKIKEIPGDNYYQNAIFQEYLNNTDAEWTLFLDDDEFLWFPNIFNNVHEFLEAHIKKNPKDMEALAIYWKFISSKNYIQNRTDTQMNVFHDVFDYEHHNIREINQRTLIKSFFKKSACKYKHENHFPICDHIYDIFGNKLTTYKGNDNLIMKDYYPCILHYYYKTADEWIKKHRRRSCSDKNRIYPGSQKSDEELMKEYNYCIKFFKSVNNE